MAYTTGINENLLIKGAADVAPKFAGYSEEIGRFKENLTQNALLRQKQLDVEKNENELRSKQYLSIDNVDTAGLGTDVLGSTTAYATDVKNKAFDLIKNKSNLGVTEFNVQYSSLLKEIEGLNGMNKIKKALGTQYIESMKNGDAAPWANSPNQELIQLAVDQDIKDKKWIKKDGKFLLSVTKDGKTTDINLADLKPVETSDPSIFLTIEDQARKRLQASSLTPGSLTPERVRSVAEKTVLGLTDEQAKNAALYYVLTNVETGAKLSKEAQVKYFTPPPGVPPEQHMFKIRKDVENILYDRELIAYGVDLNKSKMPKPSPPPSDKLTLPERVVNQVRRDLDNATKTVDKSGILNLSKISPVSESAGGDIKNIYQKQLQDLGLNSTPIYGTKTEDGEEVQTDKIIGLSIYNPRIESAGEKYFAEELLFGSDPNVIWTQIFSAIGARYKDINFKIPKYNDPVKQDEVINIGSLPVKNN